jgi:hypothetical protein
MNMDYSTFLGECIKEHCRQKQSCAAVEGDVQALNHLLERLKDVPVPSHTSSRGQHGFIPVNTLRPVHQTH